MFIIPHSSSLSVVRIHGRNGVASFGWEETKQYSVFVGGVRIQRSIWKHSVKGIYSVFLPIIADGMGQAEYKEACVNCINQAFTGDSVRRELCKGNCALALKMIQNSIAEGFSVNACEHGYRIAIGTRNSTSSDISCLQYDEGCSARIMSYKYARILQHECDMTGLTFKIAYSGGSRSEDIRFFLKQRGVTFPSSETNSYIRDMFNSNNDWDDDAITVQKEARSKPKAKRVARMLTCLMTDVH